MYEAQYRYIKKNKDKYAEYSRKHWYKLKEEDPEKFAAKKATAKAWRQANKDSIREKQRALKRQRKLEAIEYLGGQCNSCGGEFHPAVYEFHHRDPATKERDPSKLLGLSWSKVTAELDKCDLLCANCHRMKHHDWSVDDVEE